MIHPAELLGKDMSSYKICSWEGSHEIMLAGFLILNSGYDYYVKQREVSEDVASLIESISLYLYAG
jgi:hypothetical protein